MADFDLLRRTEVDLSRYLPQFLAEDSHMKASLDTLSWEHEKVRQAVIDVAKQFFVESATWGLSLWESFLNITPNKDDTTEQRRKVILIRLQGTGISTVKAMETIVNTWGTGYIVEHNSEYYFSIYISTDKPRNLKRMKEQIFTYKPAHLGVNIYLGYSWNGKINFDGKYTFGSTTALWEEDE